MLTAEIQQFLGFLDAADDGAGTEEIAVFPEAWDQYKHLLKEDELVVVQAGPPAKLLSEPGPLRTLTARGH